MSPGPLVVGEVFLGKYEILGLIGRGGFGCVYRANNLFMGREVALKVLDRPGGLTEELRHRGQREAAILGRIEHENLVRIFDAGINEQGQLYLVMELLKGETLSDRLRRTGRLEWDESLDLLYALCRGLEAAHAQGAVHRDLKPANIFITEAGALKILDFGVAKITGAGGFETDRNLLVGTTLYTSPEQIQGSPATPVSDIYALGLIAYEMFSGRHPILWEKDAIDLKDRRSVVWWHIRSKPPLLHEVVADLPELIARLVNTAMAKRPEQRFSSAVAMATKVRNLRGRRQGKKAESPAPAPGTANSYVAEPTPFLFRRKEKLGLSAESSSRDVSKTPFSGTAAGLSGITAGFESALTSLQGFLRVGARSQRIGAWESGRRPAPAAARRNYSGRHLRVVVVLMAVSIPLFVVGVMEAGQSWLAPRHLPASPTHESILRLSVGYGEPPAQVLHENAHTELNRTSVRLTSLPPQPTSLPPQPTSLPPQPKAAPPRVPVKKSPPSRTPTIQSASAAPLSKPHKRPPKQPPSSVEKKSRTPHGSAQETLHAPKAGSARDRTPWLE